MCRTFGITIISICYWMLTDKLIFDTFWWTISCLASIPIIFSSVLKSIGRCLWYLYTFSTIFQNSLFHIVHHRRRYCNKISDQISGSFCSFQISMIVFRNSFHKFIHRRNWSHVSRSSQQLWYVWNHYVCCILIHSLNGVKVFCLLWNLLPIIGKW